MFTIDVNQFCSEFWCIADISSVTKSCAVCLLFVAQKSIFTPGNPLLVAASCYE